MTIFFVGPYLIDNTIRKVNQIVLKTGYPESELMLLFFQLSHSTSNKHFYWLFHKIQKTIGLNLNIENVMTYRSCREMPELIFSLPAFSVTINLKMPIASDIHGVKL